MTAEASLGAIVDLVDGGDVETAVDRFEHDWIELTYTEDDQAFHALLSRLPATLIAERPGLRFVAVASGYLPVTESWAVVDDAVRETRRGSGGDEETVLAYLLSAVQYRREGQLVQARLLLDGVRPVIQRLGGDGMPGFATFARAQYATAALLSGDMTGARNHLVAALELAGGSASRTTSYLVGQLALIHAMSGEGEAADRLLVELDGQSPLDLGRRTADAVHLVRMVRALDRWELPQLEALVRSRPPASFGAWWPFALWAHSEFLLLSGRYEQGLRLIRQAEEAQPPGTRDEGLAREIIRAVQADLHTAMGDLREAWIAVEPGSARSSWSTVAEVAVLYCSGEFDTVRYASRVARTSRDLPVRQQVRLGAVEAAAAYAQGNEPLARDLLAAAERLATAHGWSAFACHVPRLLLDAALRLGWLDAEALTSRLPAPTPWIPRPAIAAPLSPRERAVLRLLVAGESRAGMAERLGVSVNTVKTQIRSIYAKLGVTSRSELTRKIAAMPPAWTYGVLQ